MWNIVAKDAYGAPFVIIGGVVKTDGLEPYYGALDGLMPGECAFVDAATKNRLNMPVNAIYRAAVAYIAACIADAAPVLPTLYEAVDAVMADRSWAVLP